jgi:hypothetical protein
VPAIKPWQKEHHNIAHRIYYKSQSYALATGWTDDGPAVEYTTTDDEAVIDASDDDNDAAAATSFSVNVAGLTIGKKYFFAQEVQVDVSNVSNTTTSELSAFSAGVVCKRKAQAPASVSATSTDNLRNVDVTFNASSDEPDACGAEITGYQIQVRDAANNGAIVPLASGNYKEIAADGDNTASYATALTLASDPLPGKSYYVFVKATGTGIVAAAENTAASFKTTGKPIIVTNTLAGVGNSSGNRSIVLNYQGAQPDAIYIMAFADDDTVALKFIASSLPTEENEQDHTFNFILQDEGGVSYTGALSMMVVILSTDVGSDFKQLL